MDLPIVVNLYTYIHTYIRPIYYIFIPTYGGDVHNVIKLHMWYTAEMQCPQVAHKGDPEGAPASTPARNLMEPNALSPPLG